MTYHVFDLLYVEPDQVREFLISVAKEGLVGGVYLWINKTNGKMYVGSSIDLYSRISYYLALKNVHGIIGQGLRKYGFVSFILVIFLVPEATAPLVLSLDDGQGPIIDSGICAYNILPTAGSSAGYKHTDEAKEKMSAAKRGKTPPNKGANHSEETKAKISASMEGNSNSKGYKLSDEHKEKISTARKGQNLSDEHKAKISVKRSKAVFLYVVHAHGLGLPKSSLYRYITNRTLFQIKGVSYIVSRDGNLGFLNSFRFS